MFSRTKLFSASLTLAVFTILAMVGLAQQPQNPDQNQSPDTNAGQRPGRGEGRGFGHGGPGGAFGPGVLRELNLTDDQQQQIHTLLEQSMTSTKAQREELRQLGEKRSEATLTADEETRANTLREQMRASMQETHSKILAILTAEQKAKAEEIMKQRRANHERFGERRGFPGQKQDNPPPQKPVTPPNER